MKYIFIAFTCLACTNISRRHNTPQVSAEILDTVKSAPAGIYATPVLFETAFIKGTTQKVDNSIFNLYGITIGKIKITSGHIIVCDPMHIDEYGIPFTQVFPIGEFPVQLSIAKLGEGELAAFARINFSEEPVAKWEFALQEGQKPIPLGGKQTYTYGVDGGVAIFMDEGAIKSLDEKTVANFDGEVFKAMEKHYHDRWKYTMYNFGQYNLAAFSTGLGDGQYATYIGYDTTGKPCRLITDFGLFNWIRK